MLHLSPRWLVIPAFALAVAACGDEGVDFVPDVDVPADKDDVAAPNNNNNANNPPANNNCPAPVDFSVDGGGMALAAGQVIQSDFQQVGIFSVDCVNGNTNHPNKCIIFDSASPTGGDDDLGTPNADFGGPGIGSGGEIGQVGVNDTALGNLLIIAEDDIDADSDGLVDVPDDESYGGVMTFTFDGPTTVDAITLVDIDANEPGIVDITFDGGGSMSVPFQLLGSNSVQKIALAQQGVVSIGVHLCSSGAVAELDFCPEEEGCVVDNDCGETELCVNQVCEPKPATVGGMTFSDSNSNGIVDGVETGLAGVAVELYVDADQDNLPDTPTSAESAVVSDAAGAYSLANINAYGTYVIGFQDLSTFNFGYTAQDAGTDDLVDSDVDPLTGFTPHFTALPGAIDNTVSCGYKPLGGGI